jgi:beta-1,3-galactosyltransferase 1
MMGYPKLASIQEKLKLEADIYKDIVQEDFIDAYRNITYKGIMAMKWIAEFCPSAKYILKVDDDIISNLFILLRHLNSLSKRNMLLEKKICCLGWRQYILIYYITQCLFCNYF